MFQILSHFRLNAEQEKVEEGEVVVKNFVRDNARLRIERSELRDRIKKLEEALNVVEPYNGKLIIPPLYQQNFDLVVYFDTFKRFIQINVCFILFYVDKENRQGEKVPKKEAVTKPSGLSFRN